MFGIQGTHTTGVASLPGFRSLALLAALALSSLFSAERADASLKSEWKFGGSLQRTFASLPLTAAILDDMSGFGGSMLPATSPDLSPNLLPLSAQPAGGTLGELFGRRGLVGGFAAGFLGAGVLGVLFGHGIYGELNGVISVLGLLCQLALIAMLGRLIWSWWRVDRAGAITDLSPRQLADAYGRVHHETLPEIASPASADAGPGETEDDGFKRRGGAGR